MKHLFMVLLSRVRLHSVYKPFGFMSLTTFRYKLAFVVIWLTSFSIAVIPILKQTSDYFVDNVEFSNRFTQTKVWSKTEINEFACRLMQLSNKTIKNNGRDWESTKTFLETEFPQYSPGVEFGYYGHTSVCMPKFFSVLGENAWEYSFVIITTNFVMFIFIAVCYILMLNRSLKNPMKLRSNKKETAATRMQQRISRIIITDFLCWIPICIIAFVNLSGVYVADVAYIVSACLLLPINSAFNPILYSSLFEKVVKAVQKKKTASKNTT